MNRESRLTVVKVGGSLLGDADDLRRAASALAERRRDGGPLLVVASALQGVTDLLDLAARQSGRPEELRRTLETLRLRHLGLANGSNADLVAEVLDELEALAGSLRAGELPDGTYARLLSFGERLSVILLAAAIQDAGQDAQAVASEEAGLRADGPPRAGSCDIPASAEGLERMLRQLRDQVLVLTGFYGLGRDGGVVLFGRGGSDNTACAVAAGLDAGQLELWKDVPGFMSADPREVRGARLIDEISFDEVAQMGAFGSRIVNHGCLDPLRGRSTRIVISSIPEAGTGAGTLLVERLQRDAVRVVALASRRNNGSPALLGAVGEGVAGDAEIRERMLACLSEAGIRCDLAARPSGRSGLSCTVHPDDLAAALSGLHDHFFFDSPQRAQPLKKRSGDGTMQSAQPTAPATRLASFWNEARLHADQAKSSSVRPAPGLVLWRAAIEDVLKVGYALQSQSRFVAGAWERVRWRTVPSAGALYPFEVIASVVDEGTYLWDVEKGRLAPCGLPSLGREDLGDAALATPPGHRLEALLILVARPWLSMRKYRLRGYGYCHLDVGHLAANLAAYTASLGLNPTLHLRFSRELMVDRLRLDGLCREPLAVLSFTSASPRLATGPVAETDAQPVSLEPPEPGEVANWESLRGLLSFDSVLEPPCPPTSAALLLEPAGELEEDSLVPLPGGRSHPSNPKECRSAILARRSAKGFRREPLSVAQIGELLSVLRAESLPEDCLADPATRLGARLIARNVEGLTGVFAYDPRRHSLYRVAPQADDPRPACMQQELAGHAAAQLIFHAPVFRLFDQLGYSAFTELHFHAAQLGQRLHLAASQIDGVGITCIGGFDGLKCAELARLGPEEEAVYVVLLGIPDEAAFKHDRLSIAYSHGHTTTLED